MIPDDPSSSGPLFSVIIPLEYHRGQWEACWRAWKAQTADPSLTEIILVVPPDFANNDLLQQLSPARLEFSTATHDMGLCAVGAASARGKYLIFTEAHCWPEPDVIELCQEAINAHPDWAGFSCRSIPITRNRLSEAEAAMYATDIELALQFHPWRKILDHCFITSREAYERCGGFQPQFGHFAEWLLAASYFRQGYKLGYFPAARFHHYYSGSLGELRDFTRDFVVGEVSYFSGAHRQAEDGLLGLPGEWICQGNLDRDMSRAVLHLAVHSLGPPHHEPYGYLPRPVIEIGRWIPTAISGDGIARLGASAAAIMARISLQLAVTTGSRDWLHDRFRKYIAALIHTQRLAAIGTLRRARRNILQPGYVGLGPDALAADAAGFYPLEKYQGDDFRWSETAAAVRVFAAGGPQDISIDCIPARDLTDAKSDFRFYIGGVRIRATQMSIEGGSIRIALDLTQPRTFILGWTCLPFPAVADSRQLGLPIKRIALINSHPEDPAMRRDRFRFATAAA
jgi:hypothetical protein